MDWKIKGKLFDGHGHHVTNDKYMKKIKIAGGLVHAIPEDLKAVLIANRDLLAKWNNLTPLVRNEWICWTIYVKRPKTRNKHINRLTTDLLDGKRRPCCWVGCPHREIKR